MLPLVILTLITTAAAQLRTIPACMSNSAVGGAISADNIYTDESANWTEVKTVFNKRLTYEPKVIVYPQTVEQVSRAVRCSARFHTRVTARSGGQDFASYSLGGEYGHVVVDLSAFDGISLNTTTNEAVIGPAARVGDIRRELYNQGQRAIPLGNGPHVGFGGLVAHAGFGLDSRQFGLTIDNIIAIQVVTADGSIVETSSLYNTELFWGLKGAAPSFGIITSVTVRTHLAPKYVHLARYRWNVTDKSNSIRDATSVFIPYQNFSYETAPAKLGLEMNVVKANKYGLTLELTALYLDGSTAKFNSVIKPLLDAIPILPYSSSVKKLRWLEAHDKITTARDFNTRTSDCFYSKSLFTPRRALLSQYVSNSLFAYMINNLENFDHNLINFELQITLFGGHNSAINKPFNTTSFPNRDRLFNIQFYVSSRNHELPFPLEGIEVANGFYDSVIRQTGTGWDYRAFSNYVDPELSVKEWKNLYYNPNNHRLENLKKDIDPLNVFAYPQSIGTPN